VARDRRIRVIVAEDHPIYLEGLTRAIKDRPELELVGIAVDGREALGQTRELQPDVAVLDVRLPDLSGTEVLSAIIRDDLPTRVVMLSAETDSEAVFEAVRTGAAAYLSKDAQPPRDHRGHRQGGPGRYRACAPGAGRAGRRAAHPAQRGPSAADPARAEVLEHISQGLSAPEIGRKLHVSPRR